MESESESPSSFSLSPAKSSSRSSASKSSMSESFNLTEGEVFLSLLCSGLLLVGKTTDGVGHGIDGQRSVIGRISCSLLMVG